MKTRVRFLLILLCWAGCRMNPATPEIPVREAETTDIFVVGHGWHAGIVIRCADLSADQWPEIERFTGATFIEVGWGDAGYYPAEDPGPGTLLRAGLWPTPSVLHVAGFEQPPAATFPRSEVIRIPVTARGLDSLVAYIRSEYECDEKNQTLDAGSGLYGNSRFFEGRSRYHVFNNCNHWVARALQAAGKPVHTGRALTVGALLRQVRTLGEVVQPEDEKAGATGVEKDYFVQEVCI